MVRLLRNLAFCLALAAHTGSFAPAAGAAEKNKATPVMAPAPPPAMPQRARVARGQKVDIPLRIYGRAKEPLRFVIKTRPANGTLSEPRVVDREQSAITYEPSADLTATSDRFTFSVQTSVGVSAPVEVTIAIVDEAPVLAMPGTLDFGAILVGATAQKEFELVNRGGGLAEGEVKVTPPWRIEGRRTYQLAAGESSSFKIVFAPSESGELRSEIQYTSDRGHTTALRGVAAMPVSIEPTSLELRHEPGFALRTGVFEIVNRTDEPRVFRVSAGPRLQVEPQASVPAGGRLAVAVSTQAADVAALEDAVRIEADGFALRVPIKAAAVGPILRLTPARLAFGRLAAELGGQLAIEVENTGGTPVSVTSELAMPFTVTPPTFALQPGEKRPLAVAIQPTAAGPYRGWLKLKAGPVAVEAELEGELLAGMTSARNTRPRTTRPSRPDRSQPAETVELAPWMPDMNVVKGIRVTELRPTSARLQWPANLSTATKFRVERLMLTRDTAGELGNAWLLVPKADFTREGPQWFARLSELTPNQSQTMRVLPLEAGGTAGAPLFTIDYFTPDQPRRLRPPSLLHALIGALVACIGVLAWKRRRKRPASGL